MQAPPARAVPEDQVARAVLEDRVVRVARAVLEDQAVPAARVVREGLEDQAARAVPVVREGLEDQAVRVVPGDPEEDRVDPAGTNDPEMVLYSSILLGFADSKKMVGT
jgi:hypothetical protein